MALKLRPQYAALHEMKAQVWTTLHPSYALIIRVSFNRAKGPGYCSEPWIPAGIPGSQAILASCSICHISHFVSLSPLPLSHTLSVGQLSPNYIKQERHDPVQLYGKT